MVKDPARKRAQGLDLEVDLRSMDVQRLDFPDDSFDVAVTTFVFYSVPDPVLGLKELARVVRSSCWNTCGPGIPSWAESWTG